MGDVVVIDLSRSSWALSQRRLHCACPQLHPDGSSHCLIVRGWSAIFFVAFVTRNRIGRRSSSQWVFSGQGLSHAKRAWREEGIWLLMRARENQDTDLIQIVTAFEDDEGRFLLVILHGIHISKVLPFPRGSRDINKVLTSLIRSTRVFLQFADPLIPGTAN